MPKTAPKLIPIDLAKTSQLKGSYGYHDHPDIKTDGTRYLCLVKGEYYTGYFNRVRFGLSFTGWYAPLQLDKPGTNSSDWEAIWEIKAHE